MSCPVTEFWKQRLIIMYISREQYSLSILKAANSKNVIKFINTEIFSAIQRMVLIYFFK